MDTCNDLGLPGLCFASLSPLNQFKSPLLLAAEKPQQAILQPSTSEATTYSTALGQRVKGGGKKDSIALPLGCPPQPHTANWGWGDEQWLWKPLPLAEGTKHSAGKALAQPAERYIPPASSVRTGLKGLGFSLEESSVFSSICQTPGTP